VKRDAGLPQAVPRCPAPSRSLTHRRANVICPGGRRYGFDVHPVRK
jgi:hypothetical protein